MRAHEPADVLRLESICIGGQHFYQGSFKVLAQAVSVNWRTNVQANASPHEISLLGIEGLLYNQRDHHHRNAMVK